MCCKRYERNAAKRLRAEMCIDIYHSVHSAGVLQNARKNAPFQSALIYAIFFPKNPAHPSLIHVSICFQVVYVCMVEEPNQSQPSISVLGWFFVDNTRPLKNSEADIFCYPQAICSQFRDIFHYLRRKSLLQSL